MRHTYKTKDTCSTVISFDLDGDVVRNVSFTGGCQGNLQAISRLVEGMSVEDVQKKCKGILCGRRPTSCADQFAQAVEQAKEQE